MTATTSRIARLKKASPSNRKRCHYTTQWALSNKEWFLAWLRRYMRGARAAFAYCESVSTTLKGAPTSFAANFVTLRASLPQPPNSSPMRRAHSLRSFLHSTGKIREQLVRVKTVLEIISIRHHD